MLDVLIAGAGPAGCMAAVVLARTGARVLVVDRARFPRHKLCGDTLNPGALALLAHVGLGAVADTGVPLDGMMVTGPSGARIIGDYGEGVAGRALPRAVLDARLVDEAVRAGAQVREGVRVVEPLYDESGPRTQVRGAVLDVEGRRVRIPALVTIAADGRRSALGLATGLLQHPPRPRRWAVGAYYADVAALQSRGEMHIRQGHYLGIAPLPDGIANVCFVSALREGFDAPEALLSRAIASDRQLRERFASARRVSAVTVVGPLAVDASAAGMPGLLLAGDAAGFVDPMTGDGMRLALHGGKLAAEVAVEMLMSPSLAGHLLLSGRRAEAFGRKLGVNRRLRTFVDHPALVGVGAVIAHAAPAAIHRLIAYAGDTTLAGAGAWTTASPRG